MLKINKYKHLKAVADYAELAGGFSIDLQRWVNYLVTQDSKEINIPSCVAVGDSLRPYFIEVNDQGVYIPSGGVELIENKEVTIEELAKLGYTIKVIKDK